MKALSIRQPWAWLIIHGSKDVENRSWHTKYRGRFLVHASAGCTRKQWAEAVSFALEAGLIKHPAEIPPINELLLGGIVGSVELVDSVDHSESPWYMGQKGFLLRYPKPLAFTPYKGRLGFFDVQGVTP
ncbi:ASCH domain-containing protein [Pseudomonas sp. Au-Pse12]|uniref:ASCH domain-containing protein n=1 Tax=Pseudomonas sp. Au-Pse12 TaxID=2906459 RepID=UPI001E352D67|nr:ASCH domain-containing protein [Pseudomonas sp. Au-Pse12]MCE4056339.1 ASCH domain-containing protein [Pseudomonas sp. Au-Pse12]